MILCCGEALIDMLPCKSGSGNDAFEPHAGGSVFNTAIALGRLGLETGFFTGLSTDMFGDMLREALLASNVDSSHCVTSDRPTTLAFVRLAVGQASYAFFDENTAGRMISLTDLPELADEVEAMHFGAISLIPEPCGATYESLMRREHKSRVISLDPNIRPGFIADVEAHRARIDRLIEMSDILKMSDEDHEWFGLGSVDDAVSTWLGMGPKLVVITRGKAGATGYTTTERVEVAAEKVPVVDTVGAGDTFNAGILASFKLAGLMSKPALADLSSRAIADALALGAKAAAVTVSRPGANPPWAGEVGL